MAGRMLKGYTPTLQVHLGDAGVRPEGKIRQDPGRVVGLQAVQAGARGGGGSHTEVPLQHAAAIERCHRRLEDGLWR